MSRERSGMKRKTIFIYPSIWARLENMANKDGLTASDIIRRAIAELLKREEKDA